MEKELFSNSLLNFIETSKNRLDKIKNTPAPTFYRKTLNCDTIANTDLDEFYNSLGLGNPSPILYYFKIVSNHVPKEIQSIIKVYKDINKKNNPEYLALPKVNDSILNNILYVGKSQKDFKNRLRHHFGLGSNTTYALHLSKWNTKLFVPKGLILELYYAQISNVSDSDLIELLEGALHYTLQPILGRSGH